MSGTEIFEGFVDERARTRMVAVLVILRALSCTALGEAWSTRQFFACGRIFLTLAVGRPSVNWFAWV
ncbi:hypothetical protein EEW87_008245 [Janibacter melonis]|uniref:Uncharacterized protein n=1 Tax=Janibacter melonis TaxID=262209 RepID=A0A5P8FMZ9_9MICO|nr:hypothetical protein [Janibacter melonis]QFQ30314.1 hypothetical protein EEW87_008245 [Janibacter melonis]